MSDNIPTGIQREHLLEAIKRFAAGIHHEFDDSTTYDVLHDGNRYPPKAIIGIAAGVLTGTQLAPKDFKGGQASKCFRILQSNGFQIVTKLDSESEAAWLFQGDPRRFDVDDYLSRYSYIYWAAPRQQSELQVGSPCLIWRSGTAAGAIAIGRIAEEPKPIKAVNFPECLGEDLWRKEPDSPDDINVGIEIDEVRLNEDSGFIPRSVFLANSVLAETRIIKMPRGTVFELLPAQAKEVFSIWNAPLEFSQAPLPTAMEGAQRLRKHYARERNQGLIEKKKEHFARAHNGAIYCEVCRFDFARHYPSTLGDGFIEVHHLAPLFAQELPRRTTFDDLLLVCSNCHRMIHRNKDVEGNLMLLREHFSERATKVRETPMQFS